MQKRQETVGWGWVLSVVVGGLIGCAEPVPAKSPVDISAAQSASESGMSATSESASDKGASASGESASDKVVSAHADKDAAASQQQPASVAQPVRKQIDELALVFELPGEHYRLHADKRMPSKGLVHLGFERDDVLDATGHRVRPYCGITSEHAPADRNIVMYSLSWRIRAPFSVDEVFTHNDGSLQLKNAIGYRGRIHYNGDDHTIMVVHALHKDHGFIITCDSTTSVYDQVKDEFAAILKSFRPSTAAPQSAAPSPTSATASSQGATSSTQSTSTSP